ncbi:nucleotide-binding universal stress UspA family protein [Nocardioides daedukensis]|uniref:Nucleotide-binding universal stress UspA family protein n=1 Tax=Nocardioides daedukensis TaxID=634462 RepID=A0A7Y9S0G0_9ACTN|nr:universal stress protein [Nocardioides daedukensis]NYG58202.1 nucleotide-binding universal stress UspA family protein [Nocardioides daedukensis]
MSTIVVAWTPDAFGQVALERGLDEARLREARLLVVNGTRGDTLVDDHYASGAQLERLRSLLADSGVEHEVRQSMGDSVEDQILTAAEEAGAELIVLGLRRRTPVGKLLMGSTAQRVLLGAECAVLAVKPAR